MELTPYKQVDSLHTKLGNHRLWNFCYEPLVSLYLNKKYIIIYHKFIPQLKSEKWVAHTHTHTQAQLTDIMCGST